jgi:DNA-binding LytR/AlgR family response regulator
MKTLIIEDEKLAAERLQLLLKQYDPSLEVAGITDSVEESVRWLKANPAPDFILMDIQLADGSAFDIFKKFPVSTPVIFSTAFDQYALEAFKVLSIDYLLKPVTIEALSKALDKLKTLRQNHMQPVIDYHKIVSMMSERPAYKNRWVGKSGSKLYFIETPEISFFAADNKVVYLVRQDGMRFLVDQTLEQLETLLDPKLFFRINRSVIVQVTSITQVKPYLNYRLKAVLKSGIKTEEVIISRERVSEFKVWAEDS